MKIILICAAGMSSSLIANKMNKRFKEMGIEGHVDSFSSSELIARIDNYDFVLVGPQLRYLYKSICETCAEHDKPVVMIDPVSYGRQDAEKIIDQVQQVLKKKNNNG